MQQYSITHQETKWMVEVLVGRSGRGDSAIKAGDVHFRKEKNGIFVSQILGTFLLVLSKIERGITLSLNLSAFSD